VNISTKRHPSRVAKQKSLPEGRYSGLYTRKGQSLIRDTDQLELRFVDRQALATTPSKSQLYLVDHSTVGGTYVSSVWGREFEHLRLRYRLTELDEKDRYEIAVIRRCKPKGKAYV